MVVAGVVFAAAGGWFCLPKPPLLDGVSYSRRVFDRDGGLLCLTLSEDEKYRVFTPLDHISPDLIRATLTQEDRYFQKHAGVNPGSVARAAWHFCLGHRGRGGASTITMQLARLRFHVHSRTMRGKCAQMWRALELERHYSKAQLLEAYLNLVPYGRNIEGIGAASEIYFGKEPAKLTVHEAVALSVIPQSPSRRALRTEAQNTALEPARNRLYEHMAGDLHPFGKAFTAQAHAHRQMLAPHFSSEILRAQSAQEIHTTIDPAWQRLVERRVADYIEVNRPRGIRNAAAMLVDFRTMEVLAQIGSADFSNEAICGQIDGTRSPRSPGSTLKPFVYALAMDQGLIHPLTMLTDAPRSFGAFNPENFDREFTGPIKACDALARSRNIPAVALAAGLSEPTLFGFLERAKVRFAHDENFYGLALPLGGAEVTMEDLVRLYSTLANGGRMRNLRRSLQENGDARTAAQPNDGVRLLSPESAFLTLEMLGKSPRPGASETRGEDAVFWKTGTSHGFHDAWSIAVFDRFVFAVWIGNADGKSNPAFVGRTAAAPLLFQIIDTMRSGGDAASPPHDPPAGANLRRVEFCAISGQLPTAVCAHRVTGWFIPGISPIGECEVHGEVLVDAETGLRLHTDDGSRKVRRELYEFWPSNLLALFEKAGLPRRLPPPFLPEGASVESISRSGKAPRVTSPKSGLVYQLRNGDATNRSLALRADAEPDVAKIYWFADRAFLGVTGRGESLPWQPAIGTYTIIALDDHGRSDACPVTLRAAETD